MTAELGAIRRQRKGKRRAPARRPRWLVALGLCGLAAGLVGAALIAREAALSPWLRVRAIDVRGTQRLTQDDFRPLLVRNVGQPILLLDLEDTRRQVARIPGVREARLARRLPDRLEAVVRERRAVGRASIAGRDCLVDDEGAIFSSVRPLPGDAQLPELRGLVTLSGSARLDAADLPAVQAVLALEKAIGGAPPDGTTIDLTPKDRIVMRPGKDAPALWLDRADPGKNLKTLFAMKDRVASAAPGGSVDLRFEHRLTIVPAPDSPGDATQTE